LVARASSLTNTLADRDVVIGRVVDNLNTVLGTMSQHGPQLASTIDRLQRLVSGLSGDRQEIGKSIEQDDKLVSSLSDLLDEVRSPLKSTVDQLRRASTQLNEGEADINQSLSLLPGFYLRIGRFGSHSPTYSVYICSIRMKLTGPNGQPYYTPSFGPSPNTKRCSFGLDPLETPELRRWKQATGMGDPHATDPQVRDGKVGNPYAPDSAGASDKYENGPTG
jgi:phospholipid/cholesterol/gamma-HCH transport system substrate-binding protein